MRNENDISGKITETVKQEKMPTLDVRKQDLCQALGKNYSMFLNTLMFYYYIFYTNFSADEEFEELCFDIGLELDEIVSDMLNCI